MAGRDRIYLSSPHMSDEGYEMEYVKKAFNTNWIAPVGENIDEFEKEFAKMLGAGFATALSSGTAAVHMALMAAGVSRGDIVLCSSLTFCATANPIIYLNAKPVFIDSSNETWNMDPGALQRAFEKHRPKAVVVAHIYGLAAEMDEILYICREHNVPVIEDAAESLGSLYRGRQTGTMGDYGVFSFNGNKIITTSGGGMLVSGNKERIRKVKFWATQAREQARHYQHSELGFNYRMSNVVAGIGRGQLKVLDERVEKKRHIFDFYKRELGKLHGVRMMPENDRSRPNCWLSCMVLEGPVKPLDVIEALEAENIEGRPIWKPLHMQPFFKGCDFFGEGTCEGIYKRGVCLPSDSKMTDEDLQRVTGIIRRVWETQ